MYSKQPMSIDGPCQAELGGGKHVNRYK